ncbi:MAG: glycogen synthase [Anaerolineaceae bacterium]|nr:MAG: glycogen synthase [Anaerolineaceae bacterium]
MTQTINVLFLAAEAEPFIKVGGLGDVAGSLPRALKELSNNEVKYDIRVVLPLHAAIKAGSLKPVSMFSLQRGAVEVQAEAYEGSLDGLPVYFINGDAIRASGSVYSSNNKLDAEKYVFFSLAALELPRQINWTPDIIHCNDWHTALAAYSNLVERWGDRKRRIASIVTIHNLPFLGPDIGEKLESYNLPLASTDLPHWARILPMPLGLWASDAIVAVSPTYAAEILHEEFGCGLQEFFRNRTDTLHGILNGIDTVSFDPQTDSALQVNYNADDLPARAKNKLALQELLGLPVNPDVPLLGIVSRMDPQKGIDIALKGLRMLKKQNWQLALLGAGDPKLEAAARKLQEDFPDRIRIETRFDAKLARRIYAGADLLLMPSRYEPCGISQMIAMRYGCVPLVRAVGGLHDTVTEAETGFVFVSANVKAFNEALRRALTLFPDRAAWQTLQKNGMATDFGWRASAQQYANLYKRLAEGLREPYRAAENSKWNVREDKAKLQPIYGGGE